MQNGGSMATLGCEALCVQNLMIDAGSEPHSNGLNPFYPHTHRRKPPMTRLGTLTLVLALTATPAVASVVTTFAHVDSVEIGGDTYNVYDLNVTVSVDWNITRLNIMLTSGHLYQDPFGGDTEPNPALVDLVPTLEWDTYAAVPGGFPSLASFTPATPAGPPERFGSLIDDTHFRASWFDTVKTGPGTWRVARVTLSADAEGTIGGRSYNANPGTSVPDSQSFDGLGPVRGGHVVPEPATLALLALGAAGVVGPVRRRIRGMRPARRAHGSGRARRALGTFVAVALALALSAPAARASVATSFAHVDSVEIGGDTYNVYDLNATVSVDWNITQLYITLTSGHLYQDPLGGNTEPNPALVDLVPTLEWDTYAAVPGGFPALASFTPDPVVMDNTHFMASWFDTVRTGPGTWRVGRVTLSADAEGTIQGTSYNAVPGSSVPDAQSFDGLYAVRAAHIVPAPATLALLALGAAGVVAPARRRIRRMRPARRAHGSGRARRALGTFVAVALALALSAPAARAGITTEFDHVNTVEIAGSSYNVYDMMVTSTTDWVNSYLDIRISSGHLYQHPLGSDVQPNPVAFAVAPELEWDTYAAVPSGFPATAALIRKEDTMERRLDATRFVASWLDGVDTGPGRGRVARITLSSDAEGTIGGESMRWLFWDFWDPDNDSAETIPFDGLYTITGGHIVPEPATLMLLALGGPAVLRGRRRRSVGPGA